MIGDGEKSALRDVLVPIYMSTDEEVDDGNDKKIF